MLLLRSIFTGAAFAACSTASSTISPSQALLPKPTGKYGVGLSITELIDYSRTQPFAPNVQPVKLMISVFYPTVQRPHSHSIPVAYMPPETALYEDIEMRLAGLASSNGTFGRLALPLSITNSIQKGITDCNSFPLILFSPAQDTTRLFYNQIASTISSTGYTVVTIDAPYDVDIVQYPDDTFAEANLTVWENPNITAALQSAYLGIQTRVQDASFVLDSLSNTTLAHALIPNLPPSGLNTTHTAMFGHSLGGAASYSILGSDERVLGSLNMDGDLFGPGLPNGTTKPFMLMGHANFTRSNIHDDPYSTWQAAWGNLTGWKRDVVVADSLHYDFSDWPLVFETLGIWPGNESVRTGLNLGSLKGERALKIVTSYVGAFLDLVIHGRGSVLLDGPVGDFPEVTFDY
jgi:hypothetical protein